LGFGQTRVGQLGFGQTRVGQLGPVNASQFGQSMLPVSSIYAPMCGAMPPMPHFFQRRFSDQLARLPPVAEQQRVAVCRRRSSLSRSHIFHCKFVQRTLSQCGYNNKNKCYGQTANECYGQTAKVRLADFRFFNISIDIFKCCLCFWILKTVLLEDSISTKVDSIII
jgi:hypothetical protein